MLQVTVSTFRRFCPSCLRFAQSGAAASVLADAGNLNSDKMGAAEWRIIRGREPAFRR